MKTLITLVLVSLLLVGCAGTDTFRINSVPEQAKVYVNGQYAGRTPHSVSSDWYKVFGVSMGDRLHITIDKEGYQVVEKDITTAEREARKRSGNRLYTFPLEPLPATQSTK